MNIDSLKLFKFFEQYREYGKTVAKKNLDWDNTQTEVYWQELFDRGYLRRRSIGKVVITRKGIRYLSAMYNNYDYEVDERNVGAKEDINEAKGTYKSNGEQSP